MDIRPATPADVPRLVAMGTAQLTAIYGGAVPADPGTLEALMRRLQGTPDAATFVAVRDGAVVGMIGLVRFRHPATGEVTVGEMMWWIEPAARGAGLALLRRAEAWAADVGATVLQMQAPTERVARLYEHRGYRRLEVTYRRALAQTPTAITVVDDVLADPAAYRATCRAQPVGDVPTAAGVFHGIAAPPADALPAWIAARWSALTPTTTFLRHSPAGQVEPHLLHTDADMGDWTAIYYVTADPAPGDGTTFYRARATGARRCLAVTDADRAADAAAWGDPDAWEAWHTVAAQPNRLVLFPAAYYHSRALPANYGSGDTARLIQVTFGTGAVPGGF
jgi:GNAT superfamily N-acetyltransferase